MLKKSRNFKYLKSVARSLNEESSSLFYDMTIATKEGTRFTCSKVAVAAASDFLSSILSDVEDIDEDKLIILADDSDSDVERLVQALKFSPGTMLDNEHLKALHHLKLNIRDFEGTMETDERSKYSEEANLSNTEKREMLSDDVRANIKHDVYLPSSFPQISLQIQNMNGVDENLDTDPNQPVDHELGLDSHHVIGSEISLETEFEVTSSDVGIGPLPPQAELVRPPTPDKTTQETKRSRKLKKLNSSNLSSLTSSLQCYICYDYLPTQEELVFHFKTEHKAKPFKCSKCRTSFEEFSQLEQHRAVHDVISSEHHKCTLCGNKYQYSSGLQQHMKDVHTDTKYPCNLCDIIFSAERYLKEHKLKKHSDREKPKCPICHKTFLRKHELTVHTTIHTGERPYKCDICPKSFRTKSVLRMHIKMHKGLKDKICKECGRAFFQICDLKKHMRNHTGDKPYSCGQCDKKFSRKDYLDKHMKVHSSRVTKRANKPEEEETELLLEEFSEVRMLESIVAEGGGLQVVRINDQNFVISDIVDQREDLMDSSEIPIV